MIENKLKELLSELKKSKVQTIIVLNYKKRNDCKIFYSSANVIASGSNIDETFKSMHQSTIKNKKLCLIALDLIIIHSIRFFQC